MSYKGIILAGQSNMMSGYAVDRVDYSTGHAHLYQYKQDGTIALATQELDFPGGHTGQPFVSYGFNLIRDYMIPNDPNSLYCALPLAHGGAGFYNGWAVGSSTYNFALAQINDFLSHDVGNTIELFIWQHGEEDVSDSGAGLGNYSGNNSTNAQIKGVYQAYVKAMLDDLHTNVTGGFNSVPKLIGAMPPDLVYSPTDGTIDPTNYPNGIGLSADGSDHHNSAAIPIYEACRDMPAYLGSAYNIAYVDPLHPTKLQAHPAVQTDASGTVWMDSANYWLHGSQASFHRHMAHRAWKAYQSLVNGKTVLTLRR